jgi:hypothetical protein
MCAWDKLHSCFSTSFLCPKTTIQRHSTTNFLIVFIFLFPWFLHLNETFCELNCLKATTLLLKLYHMIRSLRMMKHFLLLAMYVLSMFISYYRQRMALNLQGLETIAIF